MGISRTKEAPGIGAPAADRVGHGIGSILVAVFFFTVADATAKWLGQRYEPVQIVFLRYVFGLLPVVVLVWHSGGLSSLKTRKPLAHLLRALLIFAALAMFFTGLRSLPLAEAVAIAFTAPLFITALSAPVLGEAVSARRWAAVLTGFLGAVVMIRPGTAAFQVEGLFILGSALSFALAMILTRRMGRTETNVAMLAYTTLGAGASSIPFVAFVWQTPQLGDLWLFLLIGTVGGLAAYFVIMAYRHAPPALVAPFEYTGLIWAALFGWAIWHEHPEPVVWLGAAIVAFSGLYLSHREARAAAT